MLYNEGTMARKLSLKLSVRGWITLITTILLVGVVFAAWPEILKAWGLLGSINLWVLALLVPVQLFSYYCAGGMIFSYLRSKGNLKDMSHVRMTRMALELNFVNHVLPSGGAAGFSYLSWILSRHGVSVGRSTMAQLVRFTLTFISFVIILIIAVFLLILDHQVDRVIIMASILIVILAVGATIFAIRVVSDKKRLDRFSIWLTRVSNKVISKVTRGRKQDVVKLETLNNFFLDIHQDYKAIRKDRRILIRPFIWAMWGNLSDLALIWIAFWALGTMLNPALLYVAYGVASISGIVSVTPAGAGVYETLMITFLASSHVPAEVAIAGTLLARVTLIVGTILFGYIFYQLTVNKYGKRPS